jgi:hypothetical protein
MIIFFITSLILEEKSFMQFEKKLSLNWSILLESRVAVLVLFQSVNTAS